MIQSVMTIKSVEMQQRIVTTASVAERKRAASNKDIAQCKEQAPCLLWFAVGFSTSQSLECVQCNLSINFADTTFVVAVLSIRFLFAVSLT
jgi:hypothetical protein